ncbi:MAG: MazG-like family protein [Pelosinus sp.]|nr:MazG-like family protein [Pelosinus sp.]
MFSHESDILRKLRFIEALKADLVIQVGQFYHAMSESSELKMRDTLASIVISCYVLARRLGISFAGLDEAIQDKLTENIEREVEVEKLYGDLSEYKRHLRRRN